MAKIVCIVSAVIFWVEFFLILVFLKIVFFLPITDADVVAYKMSFGCNSLRHSQRDLTCEKIK